MKKLLIMITAFFTLNVSAITTADAAVGCKRAGGVQCQEHGRVGKPGQVVRAPAKVIRTPNYRAPIYRGRPVVIVNGYQRPSWYQNPLLMAIGAAIIIDAVSGEPKTESGQNVVILGEGDELSKVYEKDDTVYLVMKS
ncbi:hypothetical protein [Moritella sp. F3]|uniref:hypothetical protein n=1 Tax=Moritella sp. F3 TaxID=2718882 RepID=UPI0018E14F09|nr:hypothetical protein [Moritella sp. F3]GIC78183.1 hypothetical protein FMO001_29100 [Moritella sp. F1]GIC81173.1 hypothetical protein FMO003_14540 [Moritella sp. F3]